MPLVSRLKIILAFVVIGCMAPFASVQAASNNAAIAAIAEAYPDLNPSLLFTSQHSVAEFGGYGLTVVSTLEILPPPQWVVATKQVRGKDKAVVMNPVKRQSWNKVVQEAGLNLINRKSYAKFPVQFLKISAPSLKAKWRFSESELAKLSRAGQDTIRQGWRSQKSAKGIIINFFSTDLLGNYTHWRLVVSKQGAIRSLKHIAIR